MGLEVQTATIIVGVGVIDEERGVNTHAGREGIKYSEYIYTKSLGLYGLSEVNYTSDFSMYASNTLNSTLNLDVAFELTEIKQMANLRNYNLLSSQSFFTNGNASTIVAFAADNRTASFDLAQNLIGAGGYKLLVVNNTDKSVREYWDTAKYEGEYELIIGNVIGSSHFPGASCDDWLACPGDATWGDAVFEIP